MIKDRKILSHSTPAKLTSVLQPLGRYCTGPLDLLCLPQGTVLCVCLKAVWCEKLNDNLLSVGRLCDAGFSVAFTAKNCLVFVGDSFRENPYTNRLGTRP